MSYCVLLFKLTACHMVGDYALQSNFLAKTKGENWWHMVVHCVLYTVPFAIVFGFDWRTWVLFASHVLVDAMKARWRVIGYVTDQLAHMTILYWLYVMEVSL